MADEEKPDQGDRASGDGDLLNPPTKAEAPGPPKIPDVELIVDGFGFMPRTTDEEPRRNSMDKRRSSKSEKASNENSPCASSTNVEIVRRYTWKTKNRMTVQVISYGATITTISVPDKKGVPDDIIAGFDTLEEYFQPRNPYFGGTIGRYANIIRDGTMIVRPSGRTYMLSHNYHRHHHMHGGFVGFDKVNWRSYVSGLKVIMSHVDDRFHEGYPGSVMTQITFEVTCDNTIRIEMKCTTSEPTVINLSHAPYFNLAGHHAGAETMMDHIFTINADKYTVADDEGIVTGEKKVVGGTPYDFRVPRVLKTMLPKIPLGGYDVNFCISRGTEQDLAFQARVLHPQTGRVLELYSNQPGMQFYTGNKLPDPDKIVEDIQHLQDEQGEEREEGKSEAGSRSSEGEEAASVDEEQHEEGEEEEERSEGSVSYGYVPLMGKNGTYYKKHGLFSLMPQNYPDAVNNRNFPTSVLNPGEVYIHRIQYKFGILLGRYV